MLGHPLIGTDFGEALDADSSRQKWESLFAAGTSTACELVLAGKEILAEPRDSGEMAALRVGSLSSS